MQTHVLPASIERPSKFSYLMGLYAQNYWALTRILGPQHQEVGRYRSAGNVGLPLCLQVLERAPFTLELKLSYAMLDGASGQPDPSAHVRLYLDAQLAEVTACYFGSRLEHALGRAAPGKTVLRYRLQMNSFFAKWLDYLEHTGHNRFAWLPESADPV